MVHRDLTVPLSPINYNKEIATIKNYCNHNNGFPSDTIDKGFKKKTMQVNIQNIYHGRKNVITALKYGKGKTVTD